MRKSGAAGISVQLVDAPAGACLWPTSTSSRTPTCSTCRTRSQQAAGAGAGVLRNVAGCCRQRRGGSHRLESRGPGHLAVPPCHRPTHPKARELFRQAARIDAELTGGAAVDRTRECRPGGLRLERRSGARPPGRPRRRARGGADGRTEPLRALQRAGHRRELRRRLLPRAAQRRQGDRAESELRPGHLAVRGAWPLFAGDAERAAARWNWASSIAPDPQNFAWYTFAALAFLFAGQPEIAGACNRRAEGEARVALGPRLRRRRRHLACTSAPTGSGYRASPSADAPRRCGGHQLAWAADGAAQLACLIHVPSVPTKSARRGFRDRCFQPDELQPRFSPQTSRQGRRPLRSLEPQVDSEVDPAICCRRRCRRLLKSA